jgi:hypothetical protein
MGMAASRTPGYVMHDSTVPEPLWIQTTKKKNVFWIFFFPVFIPRLLFVSAFLYHPADCPANEAEQGEIDDGCNKDQPSCANNK